MAIAARTSRLRLGQLANILSWWHPLRIAEQAAMLDVLSGGRLEFGIGRGYQNRETESLGGHYGTTNQDQERNRAYFEEAFAIIRKAWSQPSFSHQGEFFTLPPSYTKWHHAQTIAYFKRPEAGYAIDRALHLGPPDMYSAGPPVMASTTTLRELQLFPRPLQQPFPQVWQPVASPRSIKWAARHGINCFQQLEMNKRLKQNVEIYYEECAKHGWPDRLERGPFKFGWDADKRRGYSMTRYVHLLPPGKEKADRQRYLQAIETEWDYFAPFGTQSAALTDIGEEPLPTDLPRHRRTSLPKGNRHHRRARRSRREDPQDQGDRRLRRLPLQRLLRRHWLHRPGDGGADAHLRRRLPPPTRRGLRWPRPEPAAGTAARAGRAPPRLLSEAPRCPLVPTPAAPPRWPAPRAPAAPAPPAAPPPGGAPPGQLVGRPLQRPVARRGESVARPQQHDLPVDVIRLNGPLSPLQALPGRPPSAAAVPRSPPSQSRTPASAAPPPPPTRSRSPPPRSRRSPPPAALPAAPATCSPPQTAP